VQKANLVTNRPSSFCGDTSPYLHSYYWIADAAETESMSSFNTRLTGFSSTPEVTREVLRTSSQVTEVTAKWVTAVLIPRQNFKQSETLN
jgi:hypothetical protein